MAQKRSRAWRKGSTGADLQKEQGDRLQCTRHALSPQILDGSAGRALMKLSPDYYSPALLFWWRFEDTRGLARLVRYECSKSRRIWSRRWKDIPQLRWHCRNRKLPFILSFHLTRGQKERLNVRFVKHGRGIGDALVIFRYRLIRRVDRREKEGRIKCDGDEDRSVLRRMRIPRRWRTYDDTNTQLLRDEGNGTSHLGQTTPRLAHATDLIVDSAWVSLRTYIARTCTHDSLPHARSGIRLGYLATELISCIRYFLGTWPAKYTYIFFHFDESWRLSAHWNIHKDTIGTIHVGKNELEIKTSVIARAKPTIPLSLCNKISLDQMNFI